jgi:hypothetical protein
MPDPTDNLRRAAARKRREAYERADAAIKQLASGGKPVGFTAVAAAAPCSTDFLYRHPELRSRIEDLRAERGTAVAPALLSDDAGGRSSVVGKLTEQLAHIRARHRDEVAELRRALEVAHGEIIDLRRRLGDRYAA